MAGLKSNIKNRHLHNRWVLSFFFAFSVLSGYCQTANSDFERIKLIDGDSEISGLALSPDQNSIAVSFAKSEPIKIIDWQQQKTTGTINAAKWNSGSRLNFSATGKYLIAQEIGFSDFSQNKDRSIDYEIIDFASGKLVKSFGKVQDVAISANEQLAISLNNDEISVWQLPSGEKLKAFTVPGATNAVAINPDGKTLVVSQMVDAEEFKSQFRKDKKGLKNAAKYKQVVSLLNIESGAKIKTIPEFYDLIYNLTFLPGESVLLVYQTPDIRIQAQNRNLSYVNLIDMETMEPLRKGFTSMSMNQPDMKTSSDLRYFAINSKGNRFQEIHLYDYQTGSLEKRFELAHRLFESANGEKIFGNARPAFTFLPNNQSILIGTGNQLIKWNIE
jgi:FOG: WD40 repeat